MPVSKKNRLFRIERTIGTREHTVCDMVFSCMPTIKLFTCFELSIIASTRIVPCDPCTNDAACLSTHYRTVPNGFSRLDTRRGLLVEKYPVGLPNTPLLGNPCFIIQRIPGSCVLCPSRRGAPRNLKMTAGPKAVEWQYHRQQTFTY